MHFRKQANQNTGQRLIVLSFTCHAGIVPRSFKRCKVAYIVVAHLYVLCEASEVFLVAKFCVHCLEAW